MSMKTELAELKERLAGLKDRIEADDQEAITEGVQLKADIEAKTAEIEAAEQKSALLDAIGDTKNNEKENEKMEDLKSLDLAYLKSNRGTLSVQLKTDPAATDPVLAPTIPTVSQNVARDPEALRVRDLFAQESIAGNSLTFFRMGSTLLPDSFDGKTAQAAEKPQISPQYTAVTKALQKIACHLKETDELLNDAPYLESVVRGRGIKAVRDAIDAYLVTELLGTSGIDVTVNDGISFDNLLKAKMNIVSATGYVPDAIIVNPADLQTLLLEKDASTKGQYYMGGPAYAPYGGDRYAASLPIWGMQVVMSNAISSGTAIVGAFKDGASVVTKAGEGFRVEVANMNEDDFVKNMITVRVEERIAEAVRVPAAFAKVFTAAST